MGWWGPDLKSTLGTPPWMARGGTAARRRSQTGTGGGRVRMGGNAPGRPDLIASQKPALFMRPQCLPSPA